MSLCVQAPAWPMAIVEKREYRSAVSASRRAPGERIREEEALVTDGGRSHPERVDI